MKTFTLVACCTILFCLVNNINSLAQTWTGASNTDWNTASNWSGNFVPTSLTAVIIPGGLSKYPLISTGPDATAASITISSGASLTMSGTINLLLSAGASFINNSGISSGFDATASNGIVTFNGTGVINGSTSTIFTNISINGNSTLSKTPTINGNFTIYSGIVSASPVYTNTSTLIYNITGTYITGNEWNSGGPGTIIPGVSIPQNVTVQSGIVTIPNSGGSNRGIAGNITISTGATLQMTSGSRDFYIAGNWINNGGTFTANGRKVILDAAGSSSLPVTQTITGTTTFYDLTFGNSFVTTDFGTSVTNITDNLRNDAGSMNGNASTINFTGTSGLILGTASKFFYNLSINNTDVVADNVASTGDIHISNSFTNNGSFTQLPAHTTYFEKSGGTINLYGSGSTTFGSVVVGKSGFGSATTLYANGHNFTVSGTNFTFNKTGSAFDGGTGIVTFNGTTDIIGNSSASVTGTSAFFHGVTVMNITTLGIDITVNGSLVISNAANALNINGNTLTLNYLISGSGVLTGSSTSNITVGSNGYLGTLYFDQTTNNVTNVLKNFIINTGSIVTLGNNLNITAGTSANTFGTLTSNGILSSGGYLTLKSNQYGDAVAGQSTGAIVGDATVERYIPKRRAWRFLAVPANTSQTINSAWQEGATPNPDVITHNNPNPGFGTEITYDNLVADGFDVNTTYNASIKYWNPAANDWAIPAQTYTALNSKPAYCLFVRGSRAVDLSKGMSAPADNTTLRITGSLNYGSFPVTYNTVPGNNILVSNPYACPIDITRVLFANNTKVSNNFWVWDPGYYGNYGVGGYITYSGSSGLTVPAGSNYSGGVYAQSGQAFMLQATNFGSTTDIVFSENDKVSSETNVFSVKQNKSVPAVLVNLMVSSDNTFQLVDGVGTGFSNSLFYTEKDNNVSKLANFEENMMLVRNNKNLAIEFRPVPVLTDTLFYRFYLKQQPYTLKIFSKDLPADFPQAWLVDKYLNTKTEVNLSDSTLYSFTPNTDTDSYRNRFMLVFKRTLKATPVATSMSSGGAEATTLNGFVSVYPNPVTTNGKVQLKFNSMQAGKYEVTLSSLEGKALTKKVIQHSGGNTNYDLQLDVGWATGSYIIKVIGENGYSTNAALVIGK